MPDSVPVFSAGGLRDTVIDFDPWAGLHIPPVMLPATYAAAWLRLTLPTPSVFTTVMPSLYVCCACKHVIRAAGLFVSNVACQAPGV